MLCDKYSVSSKILRNVLVVFKSISLEWKIDPIQRMEKKRIFLICCYNNGSKVIKVVQKIKILKPSNKQVATVLAAYFFLALVTEFFFKKPKVLMLVQDSFINASCQCQWANMKGAKITVDKG